MTTALILLSAIAILLSGVIVYLAIRLSRVQSASLRKMEERRSSFISIISHQLRTPLSVIRGYLEGLVTGDVGAVSDAQREYLNDALKVDRDTIELVNDYLNAVKLDAEKLQLNRQPLDLVGLVRAEIKKLTSLARASNCSLEFTEPATPIAPILADELKVRQVIENILSNAIKYSAGRGVAAISVADQGEAVQVACKDSGVGIPESEQDAIFTKFFRAKNVLHKDTTGSGLGLFLAKVIVEAHGGAIWFESQEGSGTTVFFTLPKKSPSVHGK